MVLDASVALSWCFRDGGNAYAESVLRGLAEDWALVPPLWAFEVANGLLVAERRGRLSEADVAHVGALLGALPIVTADMSFAESLGAVLNLARRGRLSAYDASYLALAMREGLPLATSDERLRRSATHMGVRLVGAPS